jgi:histidinol-phosphatase (PHP family)
MEVLGFSDHTPLPDNRWEKARMALSELDDYERAVSEARSAFPKLRVLLGMECEYVEEFRTFFEDELLGERGYDYLIGAGHYIGVDDSWYGSFDHAVAPANLRRYVDQVIATINSGLFAFIAHPDLYGCCNHLWNDDCAHAARDICQAALASDMPLELNGYGIRKPWIDTPIGRRAMYPWLPFWEIAAEEKVKTLINSDAHRPEHVGSGLAELGPMQERLGLEGIDLIDRLDVERIP